VPFRIVCLLGMDDGALPSVARADEFDLMASFGKLGDRQRRDDERNLFLDLVLAARDRLLIAYTGRNIRDDAPLPPAALVDDLLDYVARARAGDDASADQISQARASLVVVHPLQPFAAPYFEPGGMLFTYDADRAQIASALACPQRHEPSDAPRPFFSAPLPDRDRDDRAPGEGATIDFDDFERFWRHPIRALLRDRLGIALHEANAELSDTEPYALDYAGRDALAGRLLPALLPASSPASPPALPEAGGDGAAPAATMRGGVHGDLAQRIARASHELPGGATGAVTRERELAALTQLAAGICDAYVGGVDHVEFTLPLVPRWPATVERVSPLLGAVGAIDRGGTLGAVGTAGAAGAPSGGASAGTDWLADVLAPVTLCGTLHGVTREGLVIYRYASPGARDYLGAWLRHLCWCVTRPDAPQRTLWLGDGVRFAFGQVDDPLTHLAELVALYRVGARVPLRFFPKSAWALVSLGEAKARAAWSGDFVRGESDDAALQLALRGDQLSLDETFAQIARAVFEPVRAHMIVEEAA
jgi:exodeoxyribonuclease V gamma subunit